MSVAPATYCIINAQWDHTIIMHLGLLQHGISVGTSISVLLLVQQSEMSISRMLYLPRCERSLSELEQLAMVVPSLLPHPLLLFSYSLAAPLFIPEPHRVLTCSKLFLLHNQKKIWCNLVPCALRIGHFV